MAPIESGGLQGWSQVQDQLLHKRGSVKERATADGGTVLYVSNKFSNPFKSDEAKQVEQKKLHDGLQALKTAMQNEYGAKITDAIFSKLNSDSVNSSRLKGINNMVKQVDKIMRKMGMNDSVSFLRSVTNLNAQTEPNAVRDAFLQLYADHIDLGTSKRPINLFIETSRPLEDMFELLKKPGTQMTSELADEIRTIVADATAEVRAVNKESIDKVIKDPSFKNLRL